LAGRRAQEFGQQVETRGLAGPVRTDQGVNAATANPKIDIANGEKAREFLGQSMGFENELIGQSNFPRQPSPRPDIAGGYFSETGRFSQNALENPSGPPPVANMPSTGRFAQGGKLDSGEAKGSGFAISRMARACDGIASPQVFGGRKIRKLRSGGSPLG
jgi:hypothetical protein